MKLLGPFIEEIIGFVKKVSFIVILFFGLAIVIASVAFAVYTPTKLLAVIVASIGCSIGTFIIAQIITKLTAVKLDEERQIIKAEERKRSELERKIKDYSQIETERDYLQAEIERHKRMRIDVNSYRAILKLGVAELDLQITDFKEKQIEKYERDEWYKVGRTETREFIGVLDYQCRANFGVDLTKLRFRDVTDSKLEVSGLESEFQGMKDQKKDWKLREIRVHKTAGTVLPDDYQVLKEERGLLDMCDSQENDLINRINNGVNFKNLDSQITNMATTFIRLLLAPIGKEIVFEKQRNLEGRGFIEFLEFNNIRLEKRIKELEDKKNRYRLLTTNYNTAS